MELRVFSERIGEFQFPDFGAIVVNNLGNISVLETGNVETSGGYGFREIVTFDERVLIYQDNVLFQSISPFPQSFWDSILIMDGEEMTIDQKVLSF